MLQHMALATVMHHSYKVHTENGAPRSQTTATRAREGEVHVQHDGLRAQKRPLPGTRPAPLADVAGPQVRAATVDGIDGTALRFLVRKVLAEKERRQEEEEEQAARTSASAPKRTRKKRRKRRLPLGVQTRRCGQGSRSGAQCSLLLSTGPRCLASWPIWTRRTVLFVFVVNHCSGIGFSGDSACRAVFLSLLSSGPDARHPGRYGPEGHFCSEVVAALVADHGSVMSAGPPAGGQLRGGVLADMVHMVQTAENFGNSAVAVHQGRRLFLRGAQADSHGPCDHRDSQWRGGRRPTLQVVQISRRGTEADSHGPDFVGPQSFSSCSAR